MPKLMRTHNRNGCALRNVSRRGSRRVCFMGLLHFRMKASPGRQFWTAKLPIARLCSTPPTEPKNMIAQPGSLTFNTVITKLKDGQQIFSNTVIHPDLEAAKKACAGQDFIWIEMQHSTLTW